jgi:Uncharacterised nucleotidyltransferase
METPAYTEPAHPIENGLILTCAATVMTEDRRATLRHLVGECRDWEYVVETCRAHGISSLICSTLEANTSDLVPKEIQEELQTRFRANARRNLFLTQELLSLVREFGREGIAVIPFKGPLLAITAYGNVALREFLDLDLLVRKEDFDHARELLATWGYGPPANQTVQPAESYFKSQLGCEQIRADGKVGLELHWSFVQTWLGFHVDLETLWAASPQARIGRLTVSILPWEITLLYLCAHGTKHRWSRLSWVVDVAEVLRARSEWNWEALLVLAESSGCRRTLFIGLHLAGALLQARIPKQVQSAIREDKMAVSMAAKLEKQMFAARDASPVTRPGWERDWFHICTKERWRDKFIYLGYLASWTFQPSDKDRKWVALPRGLHWLYLFLRPVRVAWQSLPAFAAQR